VRYVFTFPQHTQHRINKLHEELKARLDELGDEIDNSTAMLLGLDEPYTITDLETQIIYHVDGENSKIIRES